MGLVFLKKTLNLLGDQSTYELMIKTQETFSQDNITKDNISGLGDSLSCTFWKMAYWRRSKNSRDKDAITSCC